MAYSWYLITKSGQEPGIVAPQASQRASGSGRTPSCWRRASALRWSSWPTTWVTVCSTATFSNTGPPGWCRPAASP